MDNWYECNCIRCQLTRLHAKITGHILNHDGNIELLSDIAQNVAAAALNRNSCVPLRDICRRLEEIAERVENIEATTHLRAIISELMTIAEEEARWRPENKSDSA